LFRNEDTSTVRIASVDGAKIIVSASGDRSVNASNARIASVDGAEILVVTGSVDIDWFLVAALCDRIAFNSATFVRGKNARTINSCPLAR